MRGTFFRGVLVAVPVLLWTLTFAVEPLQEGAFPRHSSAAIVILFFQWVFYYPLIFVDLDHQDGWMFFSLVYSVVWSVLFWIFGRCVVRKGNLQQVAESDRLQS